MHPLFRLIFVQCLLLLSIGVTAQVRFGVKGGYNYNLWTANEGSDYPRNGPPVESENGSGYHGGLFVQIPFSENSGLRAEMVYSVRRIYKEIDDLYDYGNGFTIQTKGFEELSLTYLEMPLLLALTPSTRTSIHLGPQFGYLLSGKYDHDITTIRSDGYGGHESGVISTTAGIRDLDIAFAAGVEVDVLKGFNLGVRFSRGILSLNKPIGGRVIASRDVIVVHQNMIQLSLGYVLKGKS